MGKEFLKYGKVEFVKRSCSNFVILGFHFFILRVLWLCGR